MGLGTWQTFDVGSDRRQRTALGEVLRSFHRLGGRIVDSSPMYGSSQEVMGDLAVETGLIDDLWVATKVWIDGQAEGIRQMEDSMALLQRPSHIELMQVHNLRDVQLHLDTLEAWKTEGRFDYIGVTASSERPYGAVAALLEAEPERVDFLQINYSLGERTSAERVFPMAQERGIAVMVNRPFAGGRLFGAVRDRPLPGWASSFDCTAGVSSASSTSSRTRRSLAPSRPRRTPSTSPRTWAAAGGRQFPLRWGADASRRGRPGRRAWPRVSRERPKRKPPGR